MRMEFLEKITLQKKLLSALSVLFISVILYASILYKDVQELQSASRWLNHTHDVIAQARQLIKLMVDQETGLRGYLIVGKENFLEPFYSGKEQFAYVVKELKKSVSDNPKQVRLLDEIEAISQQWHIKAAQPEIYERKKVSSGNKDLVFLQDLLSKGTGKQILDQLRLSIQKFINATQTSQSLIDNGNQYLAEKLGILLVKNMVDQETGQRGFLITGKEEFLEPLISGRKAFQKNMQTLQRLPGIDETLYDNLSEIKVLAQEWQQQAAGPEIAARREVDRVSSSLTTVRNIVESEVGKKLMDTMRAKVDEFVRNELVLIEKRKKLNNEQHQRTLAISLSGGLFIFLLGLAIIFLIHRTSTPLVQLIANMRDISKSSDFTRRVEVKGMYEVNQIAEVFNQMALNTEQQAWLKNSALELSTVLQESQDSVKLAERLCSRIGELLSCGFCAFYLLNDKSGSYELIGSYRFKERKHMETTYAPGEGLVGQCALERKTMQLNHVPEAYTQIHSGLGEASPDTILAVPVVYSDQAIAVMELAKFGNFSEIQHALMEQQVPNIALGLRSLLNSIRTQDLLEETQAQAEELQVREEELNDNNELLERQAEELRKSQEKLQKSNSELQSQQEELRVANEELEEKAQDLNASQTQLEERNEALNEAKSELEKHAEQLAVSSQYKSEFLANMSHELRTPLNSLLILSKLLKDNKEGNLTEKQVDYASNVHDSGEDLLNLINDILDLSKIESGRMEVHVEMIQLANFIHAIQNKFLPMADKKGVELEVISTHAPQQWHSDGQKLNQVIKNLLSNAIKFTEQGKVTLNIGPVPVNITPASPALQNQNIFSIRVTDTGIGIPADKQQLIFEAFQQVDGTTSRKFGGTGLGLSISRELARLLQGEIHLHSEVGVGSTFTLILPAKLQANENIVASHSSSPIKIVEPMTETIETSLARGSEVTNSNINSEQVVTELSETPESSISEFNHSDQQIDDDRHILKAGDKALLIIEDDPRFASIVVDLARNKGFAVLVAENGHTGLHFADLYRPSGIVLDLGLPDMSGWDVMEHLKSSPVTRHIPVHIMSASDRSMDAMKGGAIGFYTKPVSIDDLEQSFSRIEELNQRAVKQLLLVEDDAIHLKSMKELLDGDDIEIKTADTGEEAEKLIAKHTFDCIVLDIGLPDMSGLKLLESMRARKENDQIPVVVHSGRELDPKERSELDKYAQSVIIKNARSPERLLDDTTLFLHRVEDQLPEQQRRTIRMLHDSEALFVGRKVLLVDDDMRNIFSLSAVLQEKEMDVYTAANGQEALDSLAEQPDISLVLMDIMMPEMDGYEAMRRIRAQEQFQSLPIIALTAKAMKGDRSQCIKAGANDYLAKPVDTEKLLSMMRVWLYQ